MSTLVDRVIIVTGASSGIGAATVRELAAAGAKLVITARREDRLKELADSLDNVVAKAGDILDPTLAQALIDLAIEKFGKCDAVINNAGFMTAGTVESIDIEYVCQMARVNVEATYRMAYTAARHFKKKGSGHLVNISSVLGTKIRPTAGAYAGTKHAIEALSEDLRIELASQGIKVTCIEPGLVITELHDRFAVHPKDSLGIVDPLSPADVAKTIRYVLEQPAHVSIPRLMVVPSHQNI